MNRKDQLKKLPEVLVPWFQAYGRALPWRDAPSPYHVWVSEIMLQQTRIEAVIPYYNRFLQELPDIRSLAEANPEKVHKLWEGLGYYSRAKNLQKAARQIIEDHNGIFPSDYNTIRSLSGIGDYTAGAIASICFNRPTPAVDGNVLRVISRITADCRPISDIKLKREIQDELKPIYPQENCGAFTQALMELGETICVPNGTPNCSCCPCSDFCKSSDGLWNELPVKEIKKDRKIIDLTVFILKYDNLTAVRKRPESGLLSGLWEFPNISGNLSEKDAQEKLLHWNCTPARILQSFNEKHIFTHIEWHMHCFVVDCKSMSEDFLWVDDRCLTSEISLPTAFRKLLRVFSN